MPYNTNQGKSPVAVSAADANKVRIFSRVLTGLVVLALSFFGGWLGSMSQTQSTSNSIVQQKTILKNEANVISDIASTVGPSVVSINVTSETAQSMNSPFDYYFGFGRPSQKQQSAGTGVILTKDGLIMTNRHVVPQGTTEVSITLSDGTVLDDVTIVGRTSERDSLDVAFLKIRNTKGVALKPATLGDSGSMKVGDTVVAIGNALGQFQNTVTSGIISGYGRSLQASDGSGATSETLDDMFQTDAAINQGNSGGPLVNLAGEVIGINTAIASDSQSVGFAIPINNVEGLIKSVRETGKLSRPYLGVMYVMLTDDIAKEYGLSQDRGAYIPTSQQMGVQETVIAGGPAAKAGLKAGDIITKVEGATINEKNSLVSLLGKHSVGDAVSVTVVRGDEQKNFVITLGAAPTE